MLERALPKIDRPQFRDVGCCDHRTGAGNIAKNYRSSSRECLQCCLPFGKDNVELTKQILRTLNTATRPRSRNFKLDSSSVASALNRRDVGNSLSRRVTENESS